MARIIFESRDDYEAAKLAELSTLVIGEPVDELGEDGEPTGRLIIDHSFTPEQKEELQENDIEPEIDLSKASPNTYVKA